MSFDNSGETSRSSRARAGLAPGHIKTRQTRRLRSPQLGEMLVEHTYVDRPASLETWIDHCTALAAEFGISAFDPRMYAPQASPQAGGCAAARGLRKIDEFAYRCGLRETV